MSLDTIRFTSTTLANAGKKGISPIDPDGYRTQVLGGLNVFNSAGMYYTYRGTEELFKNSSSFHRRIKRGALRGEQGHPKRLPGQSFESYLNRIATIDERNVCAHISEIWLDDKSFKDERGQPIIAIMGKVKPSGPGAAQLEAKYQNPKENVCFSIRAFTDEYAQGGIRIRKLVNIVTFDEVNEPGIAIAEQWKTPGLEDLATLEFSKEHFRRAMLDTSSARGLGMETTRAVSLEEIYTLFGGDHKNSAYSW